MKKIAEGARLLLLACALAGSWSAAAQPPEPPAEPPAPTPAPPPPPPPPAPPGPPALPAIPAAPPTALPEYPNCRDEHLTLAGNRAKAAKVRSCIVRLDQYNTDILQVFARRMRGHGDALWALWEQVQGGPYTPQQKREFYNRINAEYTNAQEDGSYMDQYRATRGRYTSDRDYLRNEFCNLVRCP